MKRYIVEALTTFEISFDEKSEKFQQTMKDFRETIYKGAKEQDIINQVAYHFIHQGIDSMIEGVGYVSVEGKQPEKRDPDSGISVDKSELEYSTSITETLPF